MKLCGKHKNKENTYGGPTENLYGVTDFWA